MNETAIIKTERFMASPTRSLVLSLCGEGRLDDARAFLAERVLSLSTDDVETLLECRNLQAVVERSAKNFHEALRIHIESFPLVHLSKESVLITRFYNGLAVTYEELGQFDKALIEYEACRFHLEQSGDLIAAGELENNVALACCGIGRTKEARKHLDLARKYLSSEPVKLAQVDDTEAHVCLAEKNYEGALTLSIRATQTFIKYGEKKLMDDALFALIQAASFYRCEKEIS